MSSIRVLSWNVNARRDCAGQVAAMAALEPDIVGLQEVTAGSDAGFRECLASAGLPYYISGATLAASLRAPTIAPRYSAFASKHPFRLDRVPGLPRPELVIAARIETPMGRVRAVAVHIPTWSNGREAKILTQELVCSFLADRRGPTVLMGDFNSPKAELHDGTVVPFIRPKDQRGRAAEAALMAPMTRAGPMVDAFRGANGYDVSEGSWYWKNRGRTGGYRLDHVFVSKHLRPVACWYGHDLRLGGLSDHSPIVADLNRRAR